MEIFIIFFFIISDRKILDRFIRSYYDIDKGMNEKGKQSKWRKPENQWKGLWGHFIKISRKNNIQIVLNMIFMTLCNFVFF